MVDKFLFESCAPPLDNVSVKLKVQHPPGTPRAFDASVVPGGGEFDHYTMTSLVLRKKLCKLELNPLIYEYFVNKGIKNR